MLLTLSFLLLISSTARFGLVGDVVGKLGQRSGRGRGDIGTFSSRQSSGMSSLTSSSHSLSSSSGVFLSLCDCQLPLRTVNEPLEAHGCRRDDPFGLTLRFRRGGSSRVEAGVAAKPRVASNAAGFGRRELASALPLRKPGIRRTGCDECLGFELVRSRCIVCALDADGVRRPVSVVWSSRT
jgi:hypothetical protein